MTATALPVLSLADAPDPGHVLVVAAASSDDGPHLPGRQLDDAAAAAIAASLVTVGAKGSAGEAVRIPAPAGVDAASVLAVGVGDESALADADKVRQAAGVAARALTGVDAASTTLGVFGLGAAAEGFALGAYRFDAFRGAGSTPAPATLGAVAFVGGDAADLDAARITAEAVAFARDLVNTPPSHLYPATFAERAADAGRAAGLDVEVLDDDALRAGGYGGIVGVGQGSSRPPRLVRLRYDAGSDAPLVALVGKGITFDTGGISIKPAANMDHMTSDMAGAAAVVATVVAAARLGLPVSVTATVPLAENMPSGTAQRPGDVLTQYGGTTVEVLNTDAEGRLVLADAIVRAQEDDPDYLIDTATLTGAQLIALGARTPGVLGTETFRDRVAALSRAAGENGWSMPIPEELTADLSSRVADIANITGHRNAGMLSAAAFLRKFVDDGREWVHIDIAGPAFNTSGPWGYTPKGGTGVPVRTLLAVLADVAVNG